METTRVQKIAGILKTLVTIAFVCNLLAVYLVPVAVLTDGGDLLGGIAGYLGGLLRPGEDDIVLAGAAASLVSWFWLWSFPAYQLVLSLFLTACGVCTAGMLRQARRVLDTILKGTPFSLDNAAALRRAAMFSFLIAAAALARVVFSICYYRSALPLASYNALFIPLFAMFGLLCLVMSALFRQAAELKAENDLTI